MPEETLASSDKEVELDMAAGNMPEEKSKKENQKGREREREREREKYVIISLWFFV